MTLPATHTFRLPLLAAATLALAVMFALSVAGPAAGFVDQAPAQTAQDTGFEAIGEGFIDSGTAGDRPAGHDGDHEEAAPTGGVAAGFGGTATDAGGVGAPHAAAAGLLALVAAGVAAHRRRVQAGSV